MIVLAACRRGRGDLEPRRGGTVPTKAGTIVRLLPVCVVGCCIVVAAAPAGDAHDPHDDGLRPRHADIPPERLQQIW